MKYRVALSAVALLALALATGCDKATPVAPGGTVLTISANPTTIPLNGSSTITVVGRKPDGGPLNPGTEVRFSTDRGSIDSIATTDAAGIARATLRADSRQGTAKVTASTGAEATATIDVLVGQSADTKPTLIVTANPNNTAVGGTSTITIIARNPDGSTVGQGQEIILTSSLGTINPSRPRTRADGTATATLNVGTQAGTAEVTAILGASDPARTNVTIRDAATDISLQANPATIPRGGQQDIVLTAFVTNSQGQPLQGAAVTFQSDVGTLANTGVQFTDSNGVATNQLDVAQGNIPAAMTSFKVRATTPSGTGQLLSSETTINIQ